MSNDPISALVCSCPDRLIKRFKFVKEVPGLPYLFTVFDLNIQIP